MKLAWLEGPGPFFKAWRKFLGVTILNLRRRGDKPRDVDLQWWCYFSWWILPDLDSNPLEILLGFRISNGHATINGESAGWNLYLGEVHCKNHWFSVAIFPTKLTHYEHFVVQFLICIYTVYIYIFIYTQYIYIYIYVYIYVYICIYICIYIDIYIYIQKMCLLYVY